jgi:hypothetical protein
MSDKTAKPSVPYDNQQAIIGGDSDFIMFGADTPAFPFTATAFGSLTLTPDGQGNLVIHMPVTGGDGETILHQGTGLRMATGAGVLIQQDFRYDLQNNLIYGNVSVDGDDKGNMALYTIAPDGKATPTEGLLNYLLGELGAPPVPPEQAGASGQVLPSVLETRPSGHATGAKHGIAVKHMPVAQERPIVGGTTTVTLTGTDGLASLGITETALGAATMHDHAHAPVVSFAITGGTEGKGDDGMVILTQGSGLELSKGTDSVEFRNFLFDTRNEEVDAQVYANGAQVLDKYGVPAIEAVFRIVDDKKLILTQPAADELNSVLGTSAFAQGALFGIARASPIELPASMTTYLEHHSWTGAFCP